MINYSLLLMEKIEGKKEEKNLDMLIELIKKFIKKVFIMETLILVIF